MEQLNPDLIVTLLLQQKMPELVFPNFFEQEGNRDHTAVKPGLVNATTIALILFRYNYFIFR